jgi:lamin tail-like protein
MLVSALFRRSGGVGLCLFAAACSDLPAPPIGQLQLGLQSGIGEAQFKLSQAEFAISGAAELTLRSEDDPDSDSLEQALPVGQYTVELRDGWQLERVGASGTRVVAAELSSANPMEFGISSGELTTLTFQFRTRAGGVSGSSDGQLRVEIEVDGVAAPRVLISEYMKNPETLPDADGEWLELYNAGTAPVDLGGCTLARDEQLLPLEGGLPIEPGGYLTFANGEAPGFEPDILYRGVTLPNTGAFNLKLSCGEQVLDEVAASVAAVPHRAGHSLSLSGSVTNEAGNDLPANWCEAADVYNGDFGTPGAANPTCPL